VTSLECKVTVASLPLCYFQFKRTITMISSSSSCSYHFSPSLMLAAETNKVAANEEDEEEDEEDFVADDEEEEEDDELDLDALEGIPLPKEAVSDQVFSEKGGSKPGSTGNTEVARRTRANYSLLDKSLDDLGFNDELLDLASKDLMKDAVEDPDMKTWMEFLVGDGFNEGEDGDDDYDYVPKMRKQARKKRKLSRNQKVDGDDGGVESEDEEEEEEDEEEEDFDDEKLMELLDDSTTIARRTRARAPLANKEFEEVAANDDILDELLLKDVPQEEEGSALPNYNAEDMDVYKDFLWNVYGRDDDVAAGSARNPPGQLTELPDCHFADRIPPDENVETLLKLRMLNSCEKGPFNLVTALKLSKLIDAFALLLTQQEVLVALVKENDLKGFTTLTGRRGKPANELFRQLKQSLAGACLEESKVLKMSTKLFEAAAQNLPPKKWTKNLLECYKGIVLPASAHHPLNLKLHEIPEKEFKTRRQHQEKTLPWEDALIERGLMRETKKHLLRVEPRKKYCPLLKVSEIAERLEDPKLPFKKNDIFAKLSESEWLQFGFGVIKLGEDFVAISEQLLPHRNPRILEKLYRKFCSELSSAPECQKALGLPYTHADKNNPWTKEEDKMVLSVLDGKGSQNARFDRPLLMDLVNKLPSERKRVAGEVLSRYRALHFFHYCSAQSS